MMNDIKRKAGRIHKISAWLILFNSLIIFMGYDFAPSPLQHLPFTCYGLRITHPTEYNLYIAFLIICVIWFLLSGYFKKQFEKDSDKEPKQQKGQIL